MGCEIIMLRCVLEEEEFAIAFQRGERAVGFDAEVGDDGVFLTVAGHVGDAFFQRGSRAFRVVFFAIEEDVARVVGRIAEDGAEEFAASVSEEACEAENLACFSGEGDVLEILSAGEIFDAQDFLFMFLRFGLLHMREFAADDEFGKRLCLDVFHVAFGDLPAVAEHDVVCAESLDFVELMGNKDDVDALCAELADEFEQKVDFMFGERRRRLVHDDGFGFAEEGAGDFDDLLVGGAEIAHVALFVNGDAKRIENLAGLCAHGFAVEPTEGVALFAAKEHIFIDAQIVDGAELLMDEGDTMFDRVVRGVQLHRLAVYENLPADRRKQSAKDVHEGRFTGAVFAKEGENLAVLNGK